ncbi:MAG: YggS family pyridoxal phosphate-dependent enzyme, partial [Myxococcales bacterium]|nr:YggS family pyridoxal phosphate-dependent enzyme [Myxococcales bacterium]
MLLDIETRLARVRQRISEAALASDRSPSEVRLVAVSKHQPVAAVRAAYDAGCRDFGENYAQELALKARELGALEGLRWHHIGQLQSNKVAAVLEHAQVLHGVDRAAL